MVPVVVGFGYVVAAAHVEPPDLGQREDVAEGFIDGVECFFQREGVVFTECVEVEP